MKKIEWALVLLVAMFSQPSFSQNPIIGDIGVSDPHVRVFNDTIYLYSGHDFSKEDTTWLMKDWRIFSTTDLVHWTQRGVISPKDNYMDDSSIDCWACDAAQRNGKYYFYFSDNKHSIGVMESDSPVGPFKDALGKPLVAPMHDPTVFVDDDKDRTPYLVAGSKEVGGYHIAKLNRDMVSFAEEPKLIQIDGSEWERAPVWQDKNYLFKYQDTYYLSWGNQYATSKNVYGPYECVGKVGRGYKLGGFAHGSFIEWKGQFYHMWCYYQDMAYKYRETVISYCHIGDDGQLVTDTDFLDEHFANGVGQYNASWPKIEAEWFYEISGDIQKLGNKKDGFVLGNIRNGDWIRFANVTFDEEKDRLILNVSADSSEGTVEIRIGKPDGKLLGKVDLSPSDGTTAFREITCKLKKFIGKTDIYLVYSSDNRNVVKLDWLKFE